MRNYLLFLVFLVRLADLAQADECPPGQARPPLTQSKELQQLLTKLSDFNSDSLEGICTQSNFRNGIIKDKSSILQGEDSNITQAPELLCQNIKSLLNAFDMSQRKNVGRMTNYYPYELRILGNAVRFCEASYKHGMLAWQHLCKLQKTLQQLSTQISDDNVKDYATALVGMREQLFAFRAATLSMQIEMENDSRLTVSESCTKLDSFHNLLNHSGEFAEKPSDDGFQALQASAIQSQRQFFISQNGGNTTVIRYVLENLQNNHQKVCEAAKEEIEKNIKHNGEFVNDLNAMIKKLDPYVTGFLADLEKIKKEKIATLQADGSMEILAKNSLGEVKGIRGIVGMKLAKNWDREQASYLTDEPNDEKEQFSETGPSLAHQAANRATIGIVGRIATKRLDPALPAFNPFLRPLVTIFLYANDPGTAITYTLAGEVSTVINEKLIGGSGIDTKHLISKQNAKTLLARPMVSGLVAAAVTYACTKDKGKALAGGVGGFSGSALVRFLETESTKFLQKGAVTAARAAGIPALVIMTGREGILAVNEAEMALRAGKLGNFSLAYIDGYYEQEGLGVRNMSVSNLMERSGYVYKHFNILDSTCFKLDTSTTP